MDAGAVNEFLAGYFGANKGATAPASHTLHLFAGAREAGGTQLTTGYTAPTVTNNGTAWPAGNFVSGLLTGAAVTISFTATLAQPATHWALYDGTKWGPGGVIPEGPLSGGASTSATVTPKVTMFSGAA